MTYPKQKIALVYKDRCPWEIGQALPSPVTDHFGVTVSFDGALIVDSIKTRIDEDGPMYLVKARYTPLVK